MRKGNRVLKGLRATYLKRHNPGTVIHSRTAIYDVAKDGSYRKRGKVKMTKAEKKKAKRNLTLNRIKENQR